MLISFKRGQGSIILRVKIRNSSVSTGAGLTGLTSASSGLKISTIADNEATPTVYSVASSTIETITTLGTYAAPTATKCRFKEVGADHPGIYEIQIADARFAVAGAKSLMVSISGATNAAECDALVPLVDVDPFDPSFQRAVDSITRITVTSGATTTSIPTSSCAPSGVATDQFKGQILCFDKNTTTTALRGQKTDITASTSAASPTFTVTALTTVPVSGDTATIQ